MVDDKTIANIAKLARLKVSESEITEYSQQLSKMLGYFEQISKVNTQDVEPLVTPSEIQEVWRMDSAKVETTAEEIVQNAPQKSGYLFTVPPVV